MIAALDEGVGRIVDALRKTGIAERTLVIFLSDNGPTPRAAISSTGGLRGWKGSLWEGGHRVPAIAWWPERIAGGTTTAVTAIGMDLFPTFLSLAGIDAPRARSLDGVDLSGVLLRGERLAGRTLFWRFRGVRAAREGLWKLVVRKDVRQLYDLRDDRAESREVAPSHPEIVTRLSDALARWEASIRSEAPMIAK